MSRSAPIALALVAVLALAASACGSTAPAPTLGQIRPSASPVPIASASFAAASPSFSGPVSPSVLQAMLAGAGFICNSGADYNCLGIDGTTGNSYSISVDSDGTNIESFSLSVSHASASAPSGAGVASGASFSPEPSKSEPSSSESGGGAIDTDAAATYLGSVLDAILNRTDGQAQLLKAFGAPGSSWALGAFELTSVSLGPNALGLDGQIATQLSGQILLRGSDFVAALTGAGDSCSGPSSDPSGFSRYQCVLAGNSTKVAFLVGEDDRLHQITMSAPAPSSFGALLGLLFLPSDATAIQTWLAGASTNAGESFGAYTLALSSADGHTLVISVPNP